MGRVSTNTTSLAYAFEESLGVLPASPSWKRLEPNTPNTFGANVTTVARSPISINRQRRKGTVTDLDSAVEFDADLTLDSVEDFMSSFMFANFQGVAVFVPTAVTTGGYTVDAGGDLIENALIFARGYLNDANNGLKVVGSGSTATNIVTTGLVNEPTPPATSNLEVAGVQGTAGDIEMNSDGNLTSTTLDFTTIGLVVGQFIKIGGSTTATQFANEAANNGFARVRAVAANLITLDKPSATFAVDDGAGQTIQLLFGRFLRNVAVDDSNYAENSIQFEQTLPGLGPSNETMYSYAKGNYANQAVLNVPLTDKATVTFGFVGTDTDPPTQTRATNAATPQASFKTSALNTSADIARLRIALADETGLSTAFKSITLTINNNVSPEKVLGQLGALFMNVGQLEIDIEAQLLFTNAEVINAIRNNETVSLDLGFKNDDGGVYFDVASATLGGGDREFPVNETVLINTTVQAFGDVDLGYSLAMTVFPYLP